MAFPPQDPKSFTKAGVEWLNPGQHGCYGIFKNGKWIYVGKGDIRSRLMDHLNGDNPRITKESPTHYVAEVTADADAREKELILELNPSANQKIG
jgi:hypothetical protein